MKQKTHLGIYALIVKDDRVLLIKKIRGPYTGKWDLPGGHLEFGEKPMECLLREVLEETGLLVQTSDLFDVVSFTVLYKTDNGEERKMHHVGIIYKVILDSAEKKLKIDSDGEDSGGAQWLKLFDVQETDFSPFVNQSVQIYFSRLTQPNTR